MTSDILERLNPQQREAVTAVDGPVLVIAGAGSGKTRVITHRVAYLVLECGVPSWQIFASTFTNKAAREMRDRIGDLIGAADRARLSISTFHSLCAMLLRREAEKADLSPRFTILDGNDQKAVVKSVMQRLEIDPKALTPAQALGRIGLAKIRMLAPEDAAGLFEGRRQDEYLEIYAEYERMLKANDAVDFDDLLLKVVRLFSSDPQTLAHYRDRYRHILVDEYQDTNLVQFRLVQLLAGEAGNICVVGDEDQSIYSWRGAEIANLLNFQKAFPGARLIRLEQNYRSTKTILATAAAVIERNTERLGKNLWSEGPQGPPPVVAAASSARGEAVFVVDQIRKLHLAERIPYREMAVFYRVNALSRAVEDQLRAEDIPYRVVGGLRFYDRLEIKDLLAYLQAVASPSSNLALARVLNRPKRGIGDQTLRKLEGFAYERGIPLSMALTNEEALSAAPKKAREALKALAAQFEGWRKRSGAIPLADLLEEILEDTGYRDSFGDADTLEAITRSQNVDELLSSIREYEKNAEDPSLLDYLEKIALASSADEAEGDREVVSLMTLHTAKGLEFRVIFMIGLEDGLFPSARSIEERGNAEEERRLFYVGITRAKERLYLLWARTRNLYGREDWTTPSMFLNEIPKEIAEPIEVHDASFSDALFARRRPARQPYRSGRPAPKRPAGAFQVGQRVEHLFLGQGEIVAVEGENHDRRLLIRFADGQTGEILERYGDLRRIGA